MKYILAAVLNAASLLILLTSSPTLAESPKPGANFEDALGPAQLTVADGAYVLAAGTGMNSQPGTIEFTLPADALIKQVLLYWEGWYDPQYAPYSPDSDITLTPAGSPLPGLEIGGDIVLPYTSNRPVTFRADISTLDLVQPGTNAFSVSGLNFNNSSDGAGMLVIYDRPASLSGLVQIRDGSDFALIGQPQPFGETVPQRFALIPRPYSRQATLVLFVSSLDGGLQNHVDVVVGTGNGTQSQLIFDKRFTNTDGNRWDTVTLPLTLPANTDSVTVQLFSGPSCEEDAVTNQEECPGSFVWNMAALSVPEVNNPPVCEIAGPYNVPCAGNETVINIDGRNAYDPEGRLLSYSWTTDCAQSTFPDLNAPLNALTLRRPAAGSAQICFVSLRVSDGKYQSTCQTRIEVPGCRYDCLGQLNGNARIDACGVCDGRNECLDCKSVPNGGAKVDLCGVCGGDNSTCSDCLGTPGGKAVIDLCGVCGGNNSTCADCLGVPNGKATLDRCGVCNGDNACEQCVENSALGEINLMFQQSARQKENTMRLIKDMLAKCRANGASVKRGKKMYAAAKSLWEKYKTTTVKIPPVTKTCARICQQSDNTDNLNQLLQAARYWHTFAQDAYAAYNKCLPSGGKCSGSIADCKKRLKARIADAKLRRLTISRLYKETISSVERVPRSTYRCN